MIKDSTFLKSCYTDIGDHCVDAAVKKTHLSLSRHESGHLVGGRNEFFMFMYLPIKSGDYKKWCKDLKPSTIILFMFLLFVHNLDSGTSYFGQKRIEEETRLNQRTIRRSLKELEDKRYITVKRGVNSANTVRIGPDNLSSLPDKKSFGSGQFGRRKDQTGTIYNNKVNEFGFVLNP